MTIEAEQWRLEAEQRNMAWAVWHIAALTRAKKMPALQALIRQPDAKPLSEDEAHERRAEFRKLKEKWEARQP